jgi:4-alpha-glucanotransferase
VDRQLAALAAAHGVATQYTDSTSRARPVAPETVVQVLGLLGVDATTPAAVGAALTAVRARRAADRLPPTVVLRQGNRSALPTRATVTLENGGTVEVGDRLPPDLPLGWHRLACGDQDVHLIVVPSRLPAPPTTWGWMLQLYALHSPGSWGMGDLHDLADFARWADADSGAGLILLNPLHAVGPTHPVPASPYSPSSRHFANPLYVRVADTAAYRSADAALRARVDALAPAHSHLIDYDAVWTAKRGALELLFPLAGPPVSDRDDGLTAFATYCALAEVHGSNWRLWPDELQRSDSPAVAAARASLAGRVAFHAWLQRLCQEQLAAANAATGGMPVGIVHDLAVGVDPGGADGWLLHDVLAEGVRVGAPPDAFNQLGQDWGLAAWRPDRLAETGYAAYRDMLRRIFDHAGGLRVDHVAGLWRLWWIPPGAGAADGTYVRYDGDAMLGILALEAQRAGAVVVGEDLGTVEPVVTRGLHGRNMLGCTVVWFTRSGADFVPPQRWPRNAFASISTHDLPTAYGFLRGEHVEVRAGLGLLTVPVDQERERAMEDRRRLIAMLVEAGLLPAVGRPSDEEVVVALHAALAASPSRLVAASLYDVLGEPRQPNLPGTVDQYPNWRMRLPASLAEIEADPRVHRIATLLSAARPRRPRRSRRQR